MINEENWSKLDRSRRESNHLCKPRRMLPKTQRMKEKNQEAHGNCGNENTFQGNIATKKNPKKGERKTKGDVSRKILKITQFRHPFKCPAKSQACAIPIPMFQSSFCGYSRYAFPQVRLPTPVQRVHGLYTREQHSPVGGAQGWLDFGVFSTIVDIESHTLVDIPNLHTEQCRKINDWPETSRLFWGNLSPSSPCKT